MFFSINDKKYKNICFNNIEYIFTKNKGFFIEQNFIINEINNVVIV
jgi:hypothetical protein